MLADFIYLIEPDPDGLTLLEINKCTHRFGCSLSSISKDIFVKMEAKRLLEDVGPTTILATQLLTEAVLPDTGSRGVLIDTLRYMLNRCAPTASMIIIDPYLYPTPADGTYEADLTSVLQPLAAQCSSIGIATLPNRNVALESSIVSTIKAVKPAIRIEHKYTNVFHDRFWIADGVRGLFVGTSLNGIGKRYAVIDYLQDNDTLQIVQRYNRIP